ncbi:hypothetical protein K493DRAFT_405638 [Basidiobolus meristosporus CBS 931.73]|uniref:RRM domain-containing protein n=1 Tax=Basidiobolus meristosporus CBS 931.73 TaxID=1314790 RepID=A0A1Y1YSX7_9FUNG|nr:hypothetical protein K493DRAFT_405638 [Basidiobolus meristosporus CBS 931.73]|eukprot:ORY01142.1 hypothetical protein K493DRAFT_405638 [Basidiobolus meristosporus CBS 931.73]
MLVSTSDVCGVSNKEVVEGGSPNLTGHITRSTVNPTLYSPLDSECLTDSLREPSQNKGKSSRNGSPNQSIFDSFTSPSDQKNIYESSKSFASSTSGPWPQTLTATGIPVSHQDWHSRIFDNDPVFNGYELPSRMGHKSVGSVGTDNGAICKPIRRPVDMKWNEPMHGPTTSHASPNGPAKFGRRVESDIYASTYRLLNEDPSRNLGAFSHPPQYSPFGHTSNRAQHIGEQTYSANWNWSAPTPKPQPTIPLPPNRHVGAGYGSAEPNEKIVPSRNQIDVWKIAHGYDNRTTFMIRNIPNRYTQKMLLECLDETHKGEYDFVYLRMDFKNHCNVGYAFINFIDVSAVLSFIENRVGRKWSKFNSDKICHLSYANIQGKMALIEKFRNSSVMDKDPSYRPKIFYSSGLLKGMEEPFPLPGRALTAPTEKSLEETYTLSSRMFAPVDFNAPNTTMVLPHQVKTPSRVDWRVDWQEFDSDTDSGISNSLEDSLDNSFGSLTISGSVGANVAGHFVCKN